jgi:uncharacterized membrane protein
VRDVVASSSSQQGTGSFDPSFDAESEDTGMMYRVGQAAMLLSGAALVALAARQGRSWKTVGAAALAGAPLLYKGTTGRWPVPLAASRKASDTLATDPIQASVTIAKPASELYAFWRRLENLPRFMNGLERVTELGDGRSHWVGKSPMGFRAEWDAEIADEREGELIAWRSLPSSQIHNAGTVFFEETRNGRGTIVRVTMEIGGNGLTQAVGKVLGGPTEQQVREDLRRFKELMETGEVATTDGQPHGTRSLIGHIHSPF